MANRRDKLNQSNPLGLKRIPSAQEMLSDMARDDGPEPIEMVNIFEILPDPQQPRRAVPLSILSAWDGDTISVKSGLLNPWFNAYGHEAGMTYDEVKSRVEAVVWGKAPEREESHKPGPYEASLFKIVDLAASIRDKGLINPITIFRIDHTDFYRIETGERRWLAYHLLSTLEAAGWFKIPARVIEAPNIWKQAYENNTRDNLNAIAKARQFALLLMETLKHDHRFEPFEAFDDEQDFYAQVADGNAFPIPRGSGEKLVAAIGIQNTRQLRDLRRLLKLPPEIWRAADERGWREGRLRQMLEDAKGHHGDLMRLFARELTFDDTAESDGVPIGTAQTSGSAGVPIGTAETARVNKAAPSRKKVKPKPKEPILPDDLERDIRRLRKKLKAILELAYLEDTDENEETYGAVAMIADIADNMRDISTDLNEYIGRGRR